MVAERGVIQDDVSFVPAGRLVWVSADNALMQRSGSANNGDEVFSVKLARERSGGEITSENDDMSSDKGGERPPRRKSKGSCLKLI
jgi:hypothetical protein